MKQNRDEYEMPLKILSYEELYGWTMDAIVKQVYATCLFTVMPKFQSLTNISLSCKLLCRLDAKTTAHSVVYSDDKH